jgi:hypothetical protein
MIMNKKILAIVAIGGLVAGLCSQVLADPAGAGGSTVISPTMGGLEADAVAGGAGQTTAAVQQTVHLNLPKATALHLAVTDLMFDLSTLGQANDPYAGKRICVYGKMDDKGNVSDKAGGPTGSGAIRPLGTQYKFAGDWPKIEIDPATHDGIVENYPPIRRDTKGNLIPGSKNHFVCYSSFILQKFSNGDSWTLSVARKDPVTPTKGRINDLYIQDNPCHEAGGIDLQKVPDTGSVSLLTRSGTTGSIVSAYLKLKGTDTTCGTKSWLDDLVILAVKVDGETAGDNKALLEYTLASTFVP